VSRDEVDAVVAGTRVLGALIAESMAAIETVVTMPQLRVLTLVSRAPQGVTAIAQDLGVHPSNATRTCDRLEQAGLLDRGAVDHDRRRVEMTLTPDGRKLLEDVMTHRQRRVQEIMARMSPEERSALASSLAAFARAAGTEEAGPHPVPAPLV
jgi:DNA-binding MarR family transcriptional regulator